MSLRSWRHFLQGPVLACLALGLAGCAELPYYWQSVHGHVRLMRAAKPVNDWLYDPAMPPATREQLALSQRIRDFAVSDLALPDNTSYRRYADLQRRAVVWNVVAAPAWSLTLKTWCFPVAGCVGYRGYFDEAQARAHAAELAKEGLEVSVYGVPAYSTLGWLDWLGGDPLLSTFIHYPEGELARMIFHELAHQVLYVPDDTRFNESFATAVERLGSVRWIALHGSEQAQAEFDRFNARRQQFRALVQATRRTLADIYQDHTTDLPPNPDLIARKAQAMQDFRQGYDALKATWQASAPLPKFGGYDTWVANANNAAFGAQAAYDDLVPQFEALFARESQGDQNAASWQRFFAAVKHMAQLPPDQRLQALGVPLSVGH